MESAQKKPSIQQLAWETEQLEQHLAHTPIGDLVTYRDLSNLIRRDVRASRYFLVGALRRLEKAGIVFETVRDVGLRRLEGAELVVKERPILRRRTASLLSRRQRRIMSAGRDIENFNSEAKTSYFEQLSHIAILKEANRRAVEKQITKMVADVKSAIPGQEIMIQLFARKRMERTKS